MKLIHVLSQESLSNLSKVTKKIARKENKERADKLHHGICKLAR